MFVSGDEEFILEPAQLSPTSDDSTSTDSPQDDDVTGSRRQPHYITRTVNRRRQPQGAESTSSAPDSDVHTEHLRGVACGTQGESQNI